ncbi:DsbA family protein [Comamonas testosteroni]|uniref:DSBA oxidoreductase n=1 Tax=Comamonas testosteroni (strain DSM 14576 / KF-1) TaxID=399795 RepID=B7WZ98_COMTK|nr:DsbA family protein [Comamonas testosteroni]EED69899.1 DSBA oxidoreductase [Comamonas testosteroni KF-1]WQG67842.1 DsbA family protein [Comamonas testosteroni]
MTQCHDFSCASPAQPAAHLASGPLPPPILDFFHDVVCGWCYVMSPRLRQVAGELGLRVRQRSFVLQASRAEMVARFGSMEQAKQTILGHWEACAQHDDTQRIDIEGMRRESFEYPSGLAGALACQAAQMLEGDEAHWNLFDAIQHAHMSAHRNIGDAEVLLDIATHTGFERNAFARCMESAEALNLVRQDLALAQHLGLRSIPSVIAQGLPTLQTLPLDLLRERLRTLVG